MTWAATQAKAKFSEVLDKAESDGPQLVRRRKREFYLVTREEWEQAQAKSDTSRPPRDKKTPGTLGDFFRDSPLTGSGIKIERIKVSPRPVEF